MTQMTILRPLQWWIRKYYDYIEELCHKPYRKNSSAVQTKTWVADLSKCVCKEAMPRTHEQYDYSDTKDASAYVEEDRPERVEAGSNLATKLNTVGQKKAIAIQG